VVVVVVDQFAPRTAVGAQQGDGRLVGLSGDRGAVGGEHGPVEDTVSLCRGAVGQAGQAASLDVGAEDVKPVPAHENRSGGVLAVDRLRVAGPDLLPEPAVCVAGAVVPRTV
jgi:hypothetical protein